MASRGDQPRLLLAVEVLLARGMLEREDDPELALLRVDGRGYRYLPRFWTQAGVLEAEGEGWHLRLHDDREAQTAQERVAAEWITAGAPADWAQTEAGAAVMLLRIALDSVARA